jgi:hypothetical protein
MRIARFALYIGIAVSARAAAAQTVCRAADSTSAVLISYLVRFASATSGDNKTVRDSLRVPYTPQNKVKLVTQEAVCIKARDAYVADRAGKGVGGSSGRVYVVAIGTTYAVLDPAYHYSSDPYRWTILIVDSTYQKLSLL